MDLGIQGKRAIVCASSKGLGLGCALSLAEAGVAGVTLLGKGWRRGAGGSSTTVRAGIFDKIDQIASGLAASLDQVRIKFRPSLDQVWTKFKPSLDQV